eukprot:CAMPEP_0184864624 /NCGR_PEP_ID=MMETSP0580-20130426/15675_1 /TAXON_ID=1118495 /ORGANISM="Dactyliosolen fragilissimus" /LENGTH=545 /DNA_ID=CAMNT_0027363505 /DNA_START=26 /DNA_END=1660 /DNA_ORIENTATION=+
MKSPNKGAVTSRRKISNNASSSGAKRKVRAKEKVQKTGSVQKKENSISFPSLGILVNLVVVLVSLLAGIMTPPVVNAIYGKDVHDLWRQGSFLAQEYCYNLMGKKMSTSSSSSSSSLLSSYPEYHLECNEENLSHFLHDEYQDGMHVVCIEREDTEGHLKVTTYYGAAFVPNLTDEDDGDEHEDEDEDESSGPEIAYLALEESFSPYQSWNILKDYLNEEVMIDDYQTESLPWAIFTSRGEKIISSNDRNQKVIQPVIDRLVDSQLLLIMEGGTWVWPGVRIGYQRTVDLSISEDFQINLEKERNNNNTSNAAHNHENNKEKDSSFLVTMETLSLQPLVLSVKNFISPHECADIQRLAEPLVQYSGVTLMEHDQGKDATQWRTSKSAFLSHTHPKDIHSTLYNLERRTAHLTRIPRQHQEDTQVLRYGKTEHYSAHHDYFDANLYRHDKATMKMIRGGRRNRIATVFWYLSDVEEGGHTIFPRANGTDPIEDFDSCEHGLKVKPQVGKVIIFYSLKPNGELDEYSLHGACPVQKGIKWAANKWVW